jgi:hypothetical protein
VIFRNHRSHYHKVTPAEAAELRRQCDEGDRLCREIDARRAKQGLPPYTNAHLKTNVSKFVNPQLKGNNGLIEQIEAAVDEVMTLAGPRRKLFAETFAEAFTSHLTPSSHARGDDDDSRQIIADLISDDNSPFLPDDEMALRHMSGATLKEMKRKYLKRANASAVSNGDPAFKAMTEHSGLAGADFHARANERKRMSDEYIKRNPVQRAQRGAVTANRDDPAFQAMNGESLADAVRRKREGK